MLAKGLFPESIFTVGGVSHLRMTFSSFLQSEKALELICVSVLGKKTVLSPMHVWKALLSIVSSPSGKEMDSKA